LGAYGEVTPLAANVFVPLAATAAERDTREVADAIFALAQQPTGTRALRTTVRAIRASPRLTTPLRRVSANCSLIST